MSTSPSEISLFASEWRGFLTLVKKEILRFWKVGSQTLFGPLVNTLLYLLIFGVGMAKLMPRDPNSIKYLHFLIPGLMALSSLNNALQNSSSSVLVSKFHGDLQELKWLPLSPVSISLGYLVASIVRGYVIAVMVLLLGEIVCFIEFHEFMPVEHPFLLSVFLIFGAAIFGNLGFWIGMVAKSFDHVNAFLNFVILPLIYLGGVFFSIQVLNSMWQFFSKLNPLFYLINGIRYSVVGTSDVEPTLALCACVFFTGFSFIFAWLGVKKGSYSRF